MSKINVQETAERIAQDIAAGCQPITLQSGREMSGDVFYSSVWSRVISAVGKRNAARFSLSSAVNDRLRDMNIYVHS